ncbi:hypothetical protein XFF6994_4580008 [Xanthomonas citri pv. fuscans]|nr:hypothetical protein XFF6994_4580008 [Xanthomonas citri pv. fuscans]
MRQERILLRLVEAMHLIDEQHGAAATGKTLRRLCQHLPHVRQAGQHGRDRLEFGVCVVRQQQGQCGLAASRRAPQDHRVHAPGFDRAPQGAVGSQQALLPHHLVKRARPHPLCQGPHGAAIDMQQIGCDRVGTFGFAHPFILPPAPDGRSTTQCSTIAGSDADVLFPSDHFAQVQRIECAAQYCYSVTSDRMSSLACTRIGRELRQRKRHVSVRISSCPAFRFAPLSSPLAFPGWPRPSRIHPDLRRSGRRTTNWRLRTHARSRRN